jgi:hypothetical protein
MVKFITDFTHNCPFNIALFIASNNPSDDAPVDPVPSNSAQSAAPEAPGVEFGHNFHLSSDALADGNTSTSNSRAKSPAPLPERVALAPPPPHRSTRRGVTSTHATESLESAAREDAARTAGEDWATKSTASRVPRADAAWDQGCAGPRSRDLGQGGWVDQMAEKKK